MDRSARSVKQNIVEGWKRNSTREYYDFLGFSIAANAELEEDCDDIIKGIYKGLKGIEGEIQIQEVEKLRFYPLDMTLPLVVQLKLRCKEINFLLAKLQDSLAGKMQEDHTLSQRDVFIARKQEAEAEDRWYEETLAKGGFVQLPNGQVVPKNQKGDEGVKRAEGGKRG